MPLYNQINFQQPLQGQAAIQAMLPCFLCPSDVVPPGPFTIMNSFAFALGQAAPSSYAATCGDDSSEVDDPTGNGIFYRNSQTRMTDISDGTSKCRWPACRPICHGLAPGAIADHDGCSCIADVGSCASGCLR